MGDRRPMNISHITEESLERGVQLGKGWLLSSSDPLCQQS